MKRCLETAALLYPDVPTEVVEDFRDCDFGDWDNKNYAELNGNADYQAWINSGGEMPFPSGESRAEFAARCMRAFDELLEQNLQEDCTLIAHGGTIMAIMERFVQPHCSYYDFQISNGYGFVLDTDGSYHTLP